MQNHISLLEDLLMQKDVEIDSKNFAINNYVFMLDSLKSEMSNLCSQGANLSTLHYAICIIKRMTVLLHSKTFFPCED